MWGRVTAVTEGRTPSRYPEIDRVTLARCQRSDQAACRLFLRTYQDGVFAMLHRMLAFKSSRAVVDELAQETFLRAFKALPKFNPDGPARVSTWLLTVASNLAIDELRRPRLIEPMSEAAEVVDESLHVTTEQRDLAMHVARAVAALAPDARETFVLSVYHECSHEEIAHTLRIEVGTVKSRLSRARDAVRERLKQQGVSL